MDVVDDSVQTRLIEEHKRYSEQKEYYSKTLSATIEASKREVETIRKVMRENYGADRMSDLSELVEIRKELARNTEETKRLKHYIKTRIAVDVSGSMDMDTQKATATILKSKIRSLAKS